MIDLNLGFSGPHLVRQDPLVKGLEDGESREDMSEVEGIGIGKKAEPVFSLQGPDDLGDLHVFNEDLIPDGDEGLEGEGEGKGFFQGSEEFDRGDLSHLVTVDRPFFRIEEIREHSLRDPEIPSFETTGKVFLPSVGDRREE